MNKKIIITDGQHKMLRIFESTESFIGDYQNYMDTNTKKLNNIYQKVSNLSIGEILSGELTKEDIKSYKLNISSIEDFCYDLYKRASKGINKLSDEEYESYGQKVEEIVNDSYYSNKDRVNGLTLILRNLTDLLKMDKKSEIGKVFSDIKPIEV